jgi:hypothetical protein
MKTIQVPKPPDSAYNPKRPAGTLLQSHLEHLEWAVRPAAERAPHRFQRPSAQTEEAVAERIAQLTRQLVPEEEPVQPPQNLTTRTSPRRRPAKTRTPR